MPGPPLSGSIVFPKLLLAFPALLLPIHPDDVGASLSELCRISRRVSLLGRESRNLGRIPEAVPAKRTAGPPRQIRPSLIKPSYAPADRQTDSKRQIASKLATAGKALQITFPAIFPQSDVRDRDLLLHLT